MHPGKFQHLGLAFSDKLPELEEIELLHIQHARVVVVEMPRSLGDIGFGSKSVTDGKMFPTHIAVVVDQRVVHVEKVDGRCFHGCGDSSVND
ncbi:hypothetical protein SDC9_176292 [bioreactor metagenome]|uniref:Uncharacterized protein n=1 Tax=bioreactor metagenome TaxID=1076179 RepID=A0A645GPQ3_9ZZZZ